MQQKINSLFFIKKHFVTFYKILKRFSHKKDCLFCFQLKSYEIFFYIDFYFFILSFLLTLQFVIISILIVLNITLHAHKFKVIPNFVSNLLNTNFTKLNFALITIFVNPLLLTKCAIIKFLTFCFILILWQTFNSILLSLLVLRPATFRLWVWILLLPVLIFMLWELLGYVLLCLLLEQLVRVKPLPSFVLYIRRIVQKIEALSSFSVFVEKIMGGIFKILIKLKIFKFVLVFGKNLIIYFLLIFQNFFGVFIMRKIQI